MNVRHWLVLSLLCIQPRILPAAPVEVDSLQELAAAAGNNDQAIRLVPGVYRMVDYLSDEVLRRIHEQVDRRQSRPPVPMLVFEGDRNRFDLRGVVIEIDTSLYAQLPGGGYVRCLMVTGSGNHFDGLTVRFTGPEQGSNGNTLSIVGTDNTLQNITLHVRGSHPYGYGDLLGKGGPNLLPLQKQSGIQILGSRTLLRRCRVISRAFGHCYYIQAGDDIVLEDCYAEGEMRSTTDMLRAACGPAHKLGFRSVYPNRDGRYRITPGYTKSLVEDAFRTYGGAGPVTLINCVAINTRAGFEIGARDDAAKPSVIEGCTALGCERGYLLGSNVTVRRSRGDAAHGPLLYLRGGRNADVELELTGTVARSTVHALATLAGENHRVTLTGLAAETSMPSLPILLGFGMPAHGEMASPIEPSPTRRIVLHNELARMPVIVSKDAIDCVIETTGALLADEATHAIGEAQGSWAEDGRQKTEDRGRRTGDGGLRRARPLGPSPSNSPGGASPYLGSRPPACKRSWARASSQPTVTRPPSSVFRLPSSVLRPPSSVLRPPSSVFRPVNG